MASLTVGLDARYAGRGRGIANVTDNLIRALREVRPDGIRFQLYLPAGTGVTDVDGDPSWSVRVLPSASFPLWEQVVMPRAAAADDVQVLHSLAGTGPLVLPRGIRHLVMVHDVMYALPVQMVGSPATAYQHLGRLYRRVVAPPVARRADAVVTPSQRSRKDAESMLGVRKERLHVIPSAAGSAFRVLPRRRVLAELPAGVGHDDPLVLCLGAAGPRKNTLLVLEAFARMRQLGFHAHKLVIAGIEGCGHRALAKEAAKLQLEAAVVMLGFVSECELVALYNAAQLFVYPSLYEGFGLPVLEAMACGTPVIASTMAAGPEVAGEDAILVDPTNLEVVASSMCELANHEGRRAALREGGIRRSAEFTWRRAAESTVRLYRELASG